MKTRRPRRTEAEKSAASAGWNDGILNDPFRDGPPSKEQTAYVAAYANGAEERERMGRL